MEARALINNLKVKILGCHHYSGATKGKYDLQISGTRAFIFVQVLVQSNVKTDRILKTNSNLDYE